MSRLSYILNSFILCSFFVRDATAEESPIPNGATFVEKRFTITQPSKIGYVVESVLRTVDRLGIDIKLAALQFSEPKPEGWIVEYGSAMGDHRNNYRFQNTNRPFIELQRQTDGTWRDVDCKYTLTASVSFLGIGVSLGPVYAYEADIVFDFSSEHTPIFIFGDAFLPASQAQALDFMTDLKVAKVNALFVAGLRCSDICSLQFCSENKHSLPKTGLDVILCNPEVQPIGIKDFGNGPEEYYQLGLEFGTYPVSQIKEATE